MASKRKLFRWVAGVIIVLAVAYGAGPRNAFGPNAPTPRDAPPAALLELDGWLAQQEAQFSDIRPGTAKGVVWHGAVGQKTPWAVVYLHGYSASRLETAPLSDTVAQALGANVFYTRLRGHGRTGAAMGEATVQDWLADTVEAIRIGRALGERVLVIGVSTGGTLATWLASQNEGQGVAYALISPNFGPKDKRADLINGPWGMQLAYLLEGETRGKPPENEGVAQGWTTQHATQALFPMMALVKRVRESDLSQVQSPMLVLYAKGDQTVDPAQTQQVFARLGSPLKTLLEVNYSEAKGQHVLAGDVTAPLATPRMAQQISDWARSLPKP